MSSSLVNTRVPNVPWFLVSTLYKFGLHRPFGSSLQIQLFKHAYALEKVSEGLKEQLRWSYFINLLNLQNDKHNLLKRQSNADVFLGICQNFPEEIVS